MWNYFVMAIALIVIIRLGVLLFFSSSENKSKEFIQWMIGLVFIWLAWLTFGKIWGQGTSFRLGSATNNTVNTVDEQNPNPPDEGNTIVIDPED